ncbi:hypothetical protein HII31_13527 [Pseudocercospora fuligena]|uniref:N-acetylgalactosaminide beta-1,3-galactosyltransferase n=1 Tax=Pseudocercospora fuligena TaxID=685502 RepID=A0A8H6R7F7_9PEZI|nr:hypothetical protein HII31_13527 [Pseudocercospora fuligena]
MLLIDMDYGEKIRAHGQVRRVSERNGVHRLKKRPSRRITYVVVSAICLLFFWLTHRSSEYTSKRRTWSIANHGGAREQANHELPCRNMPGANETLVILKTGSTEIHDKLPVHLNTTLRCYPHYMIFSDYEEEFQGHHIYDALEHVNQNTKASHADFALWRRLQEGGRAALQPHELSGTAARAGSNFGKQENPGWKLDKWKFLPMVNRTLAEYPSMRWYVFVEVDTYILSQTLHNYLNTLDWQKSYYIGGQIWIGDIIFAHGGTGFAVSRPAMEKVVREFQQNQESWESFTDIHWAGDCILGKAFADSGTPMTQAWPIWQGDDIGKMTYDRAEGPHRLWCAPSVSYHHLTPHVVQDMWDWEMEWIRNTSDYSKILHHKDVYREYVLPRIGEPRRDWDNHADQDHGPVDDLETCRAICVKHEDCLQYMLNQDGRCMIGQKPNLGEKMKGIESGWMSDRMRKFYDNQNPCRNGGEAFIT